jgi:hypothetical protein
VVIDHAGGRIYWANVNPENISYANLDGSGSGGQLNLTGAFEHGAVGMAIDPTAGRIYWGNLGDDARPISYANLDGSGGGGALNFSGATPSQARFPALLRAPSGTGAPQIHRAARARGSVLTCSHGAWAPDLLGSFLYRAPQSFAYQWQMNGSDIAGADGSSYTPSTSGSYSCRVTAANQAGSTSQTSRRKRFHKKPEHQKKKLGKATTERSAR